jgi:hypothetical protein
VADIKASETNRDSRAVELARASAQTWLLDENGKIKVERIVS